VDKQAPPVRPRDGGRSAQSIVVSFSRKAEVISVSVSIKPLEDRILVQALDAEQTTASGLVIPDTAKEKPQEGKVVAVGPGKMGDDGKRIAPELKKGDRILFSKYAGSEIKINGVEHMFMREDDILGILE